MSQILLILMTNILCYMSFFLYNDTFYKVNQAVFGRRVKLALIRKQRRLHVCDNFKRRLQIPNFIQIGSLVSKIKHVDERADVQKRLSCPLTSHIKLKSVCFPSLCQPCLRTSTGLSLFVYLMTLY